MFCPQNGTAVLQWLTGHGIDSNQSVGSVALPVVSQGQVLLGRLRHAYTELPLIYLYDSYGYSENVRTPRGISWTGCTTLQGIIPTYCGGYVRVCFTGYVRIFHVFHTKKSLAHTTAKSKVEAHVPTTEQQPTPPPVRPAGGKNEPVKYPVARCRGGEEREGGTGGGGGGGGGHAFRRRVATERRQVGTNRCDNHLRLDLVREMVDVLFNSA